MKFRILLLVSLMIFLFIGCSKIEDNQKSEEEVFQRYFEFLKVNNDLTFSGVNEISKSNLENKEYYQIFYNKGKVFKIISYSSIANSFQELNKYIFNINKQWKEINITSSANAKQYTFSNNVDLIKFDISYNESGLPTNFQVLPFNITYDNFKILGRSVVYAGQVKYNNKNLIEKIVWLDSKAEYQYYYDKSNNIETKNIYNNGNVLYEYRFEYNKNGIVEGIK